MTTSRAGPGNKTHIAAQGRRGFHADSFEDVGRLQNDRADIRLHHGGAIVLHDVPQQGSPESRRVLQKMRFALGQLGHLRQESAIDDPPRPTVEIVTRCDAASRATVMEPPSSEMPSVSRMMCL